MFNCPNCSNCNHQMTCVKDTTRLDGLVWRCPKHKGNKISVRQESWLQDSRLTFQQFVLMAYLRAMDTRNFPVVQMLGVADKTVIQYYQYFRDVCSHWLVEHLQPIGGLGIIVEIDECLISRRKYNRGRMVPERWVFGAYDLSQKVGYLTVVPDRSMATLLPIIEQFIRPGSIIQFDKLRLYRAITALPVIPPYEHYTVNHSANFRNRNVL